MGFLFSTIKFKCVNVQMKLIKLAAVKGVLDMK